MHSETVKIGDYRISKVIGGLSHVARVRVAIRDADNADNIDINIEQDENWNAHLFSYWLSAAQTGCLEGVHVIRQLQRKNTYFHITLLGIQGSNVDTTSDDIRLAALLATYKAFWPNDEDFEIYIKSVPAVRFKGVML